MPRMTRSWEFGLRQARSGSCRAPASSSVRNSVLQRLTSASPLIADMLLQRGRSNACSMLGGLTFDAALLFGGMRRDCVTADTTAYTPGSARFSSIMGFY
ncbi:hypothetical protein MRB53_037940 [Persea americana]|nr:hypothetical protein MRB53_037940 [Persea americana]